MTDIQAASAPNTTAPLRAFSQYVRKGPFLQVSGQGPFDAAAGEWMHPDDVGAQTELVLSNILAIVESAGARFDDIVMLRVYLTDRAHLAAMNEAYARFVTAHNTTGVLPARTTVMTGLPAAEMLVEIDAFAVVGLD